jgi:Terpene cyclase DEP1
MSVSRRVLCAAYGVIAVLAVIGTWGNNLPYLQSGFAAFWQDTLANPASRSITVDIFFLTLVVFVWMVLEARRLAMRGVWLYLIFGMLVAISVTVPIFLINRERAMAAAKPLDAAGSLHAADVAGLAAVGLGAIAYAVLTLLQGSQ